MYFVLVQKTSSSQGKHPFQPEDQVKECFGPVYYLVTTYSSQLMNFIFLLILVQPDESTDVPCDKLDIKYQDHFPIRPLFISVLSQYRAKQDTREIVMMSFQHEEQA